MQPWAGQPGLARSIHPTFSKPLAAQGECVILLYMIDTVLRLVALIVDYEPTFDLGQAPVHHILGRRKTLDIFYMLYVVSIEIQNDVSGGAEFGWQKCLKVACRSKGVVYHKR